MVYGGGISVFSLVKRVLNIATRWRWWMWMYSSYPEPRHPRICLSGDTSYKPRKQVYERQVANILRISYLVSHPPLHKQILKLPNTNLGDAHTPPLSNILELLGLSKLFFFFLQVPHSIEKNPAASNASVMRPGANSG